MKAPLTTRWTRLKQRRRLASTSGGEDGSTQSGCQAGSAGHEEARADECADRSLVLADPSLSPTFGLGIGRPDHPCLFVLARWVAIYLFFYPRGHVRMRGDCLHRTAEDTLARRQEYLKNARWGYNSFILTISCSFVVRVWWWPELMVVSWSFPFRAFSYSVVLSKLNVTSSR
jgi:hypothetical protein